MFHRIWDIGSKTVLKARFPTHWPGKKGSQYQNNMVLNYTHILHMYFIPVYSRDSVRENLELDDSRPFPELCSVSGLNTELGS